MESRVNEENLYFMRTGKVQPGGKAEIQLHLEELEVKVYNYLGVLITNKVEEGKEIGE